MTKEEKQLLLKDLCARLPYKPHICIKDGKVDVAIDIVLNGTYIHEWITFPSCQNMTIKPYLRSMSSMAEKELVEYKHLVNRYNASNPDSASGWVDWLNAHHFDYRGLIEKGLALEAPEGMYKF